MALVNIKVRFLSIWRTKNMKKWAVVLSAATLTLGSHHIMAKEGNTVYLYTWSEYVPSKL